MTTSPTLASALPRVEDQELLDRVIAEQGSRPGALLSVLERLQEQSRGKYLPLETLEYVAARTGVPQARVYSVATFYALFNLEPQGTHTVSICRGTACHTRGSRALLERLKLQLNLQHGEDEAGADKLTLTTPDRRFTIRTVACFGQCALAPVVEVNHAIRGHVKEQQLMREVDKLRKEGGR
jgi:NADH-quinone oxidoreductase subunit E